MEGKWNEKDGMWLRESFAVGLRAREWKGNVASPTCMMASY